MALEESLPTRLSGVRVLRWVPVCAKEVEKGGKCANAGTDAANAAFNAFKN
jgi:hypothetical protein